MQLRRSGRLHPTNQMNNQARGGLGEGVTLTYGRAVFARPFQRGRKRDSSENWVDTSLDHPPPPPLIRLHASVYFGGRLRPRRHLSARPAATLPPSPPANKIFSTGRRETTGALIIGQRHTLPRGPRGNAAVEEKSIY